MSVCNPVLYQGVSEGAGGSGVCVYRVLRLYIASSGILFHAVSVYLQRLQKDFFVFCHRYDSYSAVVISACKGISLEHHIWHVVFSGCGILADRVSGNVGSEKLF